MDIGDVTGYGYAWDAATAVTVAVDVFEFGLSAGKAARVGGISFFQTTELGDAAHEILSFRYVYGNTTSGSGGAAPNDFSAGKSISPTTGITSAECRNTTAASGGTPYGSAAHGWNVLQPIELWYPNGLEPVLDGDGGGGEVNAVRLLAAPADSITMFSNIWFRNN